MITTLAIISFVVFLFTGKVIFRKQLNRFFRKFRRKKDITQMSFDLFIAQKEEFEKIGKESIKNYEKKNYGLSSIFK